MKSTKNDLGRVYFVVLPLATLLVYMSGLAAVQHKCQDNTPAYMGGVFGMSAGTGDCLRAYRFSWFTFAFVFATLTGLMYTLFMGRGLRLSRPFWVGMLSISTLLMMIAAETFLSFTIGTEDVDSAAHPDWIHRIRATSVGAIMTVAFLVLSLMAVGMECEEEAGEGHAAMPEAGKKDDAAADMPVSPPAEV